YHVIPKMVHSLYPDRSNLPVSHPSGLCAPVCQLSQGKYRHLPGRGSRTGLAVDREMIYRGSDSCAAPQLLEMLGLVGDRRAWDMADPAAFTSRRRQCVASATVGEIKCPATHPQSPKPDDRSSRLQQIRARRLRGSVTKAKPWPPRRPLSKSRL